MADPANVSMAMNGTTNTGLLSSLAGSSQGTAFWLLAAAGVFGVVVLLSGAVGPSIDPREPPLLKPSIPLIGHIIGIVRHGSQFTKSLDPNEKRTIATLPLLHSKLYVVWDPALIQATYSNKDLSLHPFSVDFGKSLLGANDETISVLATGEHITNEHTGLTRSALSGPSFRAMNIKAMQTLLKPINEKFDGNAWHEIPNLYIWLRNAISEATLEAIYGEVNPFRADPQLMEDLWTFDAGRGDLVIMPFPRWTIPKVWNARGRVQAALDRLLSEGKYEAEGVAQVAKARVDVLRRSGLPNSEVAKLEFMLPFLSVVNSGPFTFWLVLDVFTRPDLLARLREDLKDYTEHGEGSEVVFDFQKFIASDSLLIACWQETLRLANVSALNRQALRDTTIRDGKGNTYLLKKGTKITAAASSTHTLRRVWGDAAMEYRPDQWLESEKSKVDSKTAKIKKDSFFPFGGGRNLCPGRHFARAEIMGLIAVLVMGFDIEPLAGGSTRLEYPTPKPGNFGDSTNQLPKGGKGYGVRLRRRPGWENKSWTFKF